MKKLIGVIVSMVFITLLVGGALLAWNFYKTPRGPKLTYQEETIAEPAVEPAARSENVVAPEALAQKNTCGGKGVISVMMIGDDKSEGVWPFGADLVRLVQVDYDNQDVRIIAFSRDIPIEKTGMKTHPSEDLGLAYYYMSQETEGTDQEKMLAGTDLVGRILKDEFKVKGDHYFTIDLNRLPTFVDTIGGVEINNPKAFTNDWDIYFPEGVQRLDGYLSAQYVRSYNPDGDMARMNRQNVYLKGLREQLLSFQIVTKIPDLYQRFQEAIVTDMSPEQFATLGCMIDKEQVTEENTLTYQVGPDFLMYDANGAVVPGSDNLDKLIDDILKHKYPKK